MKFAYERRQQYLKYWCPSSNVNNIYIGEFQKECRKQDNVKRERFFSQVLTSALRKQFRQSGAPCCENIIWLYESSKRRRV